VRIAEVIGNPDLDRLKLQCMMDGNVKKQGDGQGRSVDRQLVGKARLPHRSTPKSHISYQYKLIFGKQRMHPVIVERNRENKNTILVDFKQFWQEISIGYCNRKDIMHLRTLIFNTQLWSMY